MVKRQNIDTPIWMGHDHGKWANLKLFCKLAMSTDIKFMTSASATKNLINVELINHISLKIRNYLHRKVWKRHTFRRWSLHLWFTMKLASRSYFFCFSIKKDEESFHFSLKFMVDILSHCVVHHVETTLKGSFITYMNFPLHRWRFIFLLPLWKVQI
jgi:hypothetical protein